MKSLDRSERKQLLRDVERDSNHRGNDRDTAIVCLLLLTGLRVSELVNLDIKDVTMRYALPGEEELAEAINRVFTRSGIMWWGSS